MIVAGAALHRAAARLACFAALALALLFITCDARAGEPMYVIEQLVVGVNSAPAGAGDRVATLKSGEAVEVLARQGDEAQIQLANGTSGWVKASYLSAQLPLQRRLQDQTAELERLRQEVTRLQSQSPPASGSAADSSAPAGAAGGSSARSTQQPIGASGGSSASSTQPVARGIPPTASAGRDGNAAGQGDDSPAGAPQGAAVRDPSPFMRGYAGDQKPSWLWVLGCSAVALALGFLVGWRVLDRRIRRKYGGLRIY